MLIYLQYRLFVIKTYYICCCIEPVFQNNSKSIIKKCFYEEIKLEECCKTAEDFCKDENINIKKVSFDLDYLRIGNLILDDIKRNPKLFDTELFKAENINLYLKKKMKKINLNQHFQFHGYFKIKEN